MEGLAILSFEGSKGLVLIDKVCRNGLVVVSDINGNRMNFDYSYITDLTNYPEQQKIAYGTFKFCEFVNGSIIN